jgi:protein-tyrosine phosphatase
LTQELQEAAKTKNLQSFDPSEKMMGLYRSFVLENNHQFQGFIQAVLAAQGKPVLWHCVAGKDRTGFAAAILLRILGVPHQVVMQDYMLSAQYADRRKPLILMLRLIRGEEIADIIRTFYSVQKEWLQVAFQAIDDVWGSFEQYRLEALKVSQDQVYQLREFLLDGVAHQKRTKP